jgi:hypothetical protein
MRPGTYNRGLRVVCALTAWLAGEDYEEPRRNLEH